MSSFDHQSIYFTNFFYQNLTHCSCPTLWKANYTEVQQRLPHRIVRIIGIFCIAMADSIVHPLLDIINRQGFVIPNIWYLVDIGSIC